MKVLLLIALVLGGCGVLMSPTGPPTRARVLAHMEKEGCLGRCPIYELSFYDDGTIEYHGEHNVGVKGRRWVRIDAKTLRGALTFYFGIVDYGHLPQEGQVECTDQQSVTFEYRGRRVRHDYGDSHAPPELARLEHNLDNLAGAPDLVGTETWFAAPQGSYCYDTKTIYLAPATAP